MWQTGDITEKGYYWVLFKFDTTYSLVDIYFEDDTPYVSFFGDEVSDARLSAYEIEKWQKIQEPEDIIILPRSFQYKTQAELNSEALARIEKQIGLIMDKLGGTSDT